MNRTYYKEKYINLIMIITAVLSLILATVSEGFAAAENVRTECLRLHILANSDSEEDQTVKLLIRDALLEAGASLFSGNTDADEAAEKILENKTILENTADRILKENGFFYKSEIVITEEYFDTRQYEDVKLPAGTYKACKVILGEGKGQNWWCVMFPPLCLPAVTKNSEEVYAVFGENGGKLVSEKSGYVIKFRIVEIFEEVIDSIKKKD